MTDPGSPALAGEITRDAVSRCMERSEARLVSAVLPGRQNHVGTFGGNLIMALMEEVAWVSATRFARQDMITAGSEAIRFEKPVPPGTILEAVARVEAMGRTSVTVGVEVFAEAIRSGERERAVRGTFTLVAIGADGRPTPIAILDD